MNLKSVYLDESKELLLVKHKGKIVQIDLSNVKKVDKIMFSITLLDVKLKEKTELGWDFTFMPKNSFFFWSKPEKQLQELINNRRKL